MTNQEVINKTRIACSEIGANSGLMLAIAFVETGGKFNIDAGKGGKYVGLFQLSDGYGGCKGDDRLDLRKSIICTWNQIERNKRNFIKKMGYWEDWFAYGIHQQGLSGFEYLLKNKDKKLTELDTIRRNRIQSNIPKTLTVTYVRDFLDYWQNRINDLIKEYSKNISIAKSQGIIAATVEQLELKNLLLSGISGFLIAAATWLFITVNNFDNN